jgi:hypothetical protein
MTTASLLYPKTKFFPCPHRHYFTYHSRGYPFFLYYLKVIDKKIEIVEEEWVAPRMVGEVVPMWAGKKFSFRVK